MERVNNRCILIRLLLGREVVNILSVYAPQAGREREEKEKFWERLSEVVGEIPGRKSLF